MKRRSWFRTFFFVVSMVLVIGAGITQAKIVVLAWPSIAQIHDLEGAVERFNTLHPEIEVEFLLGASNSRGYIEQVMIMQASGQQVDVVTAMPHWGLPLAIGDGTTDLIPYLNAAGLNDSDYAPGTLDGFRWNSEVWGLPLSVLLYGSAYNERLLTESGFAAPQDSDWTWETVVEMARRTTLEIVQVMAWQTNMASTQAEVREHSSSIRLLTKPAGSRMTDMWIRSARYGRSPM